MTLEKTSYEIQWEGDGNRRVETVEGHDYETHRKPIPYLCVFNYPKTEEHDRQEVFELIGHNFTILPVEEE